MLSFYKILLNVMATSILVATCLSFLIMFDIISPASKTDFLFIRNLGNIRNTLEYITAKNISTYLINSPVDYCNSLYSTFLRPNLMVFHSRNICLQVQEVVNSVAGITYVIWTRKLRNVSKLLNLSLCVSVSPLADADNIRYGSHSCCLVIFRNTVTASSSMRIVV